MNRRVERETFHPIVGQWLLQNGYTYDHEVVMPYSGIADFVARYSDSVVLIEAKLYRKDVMNAIFQLKGYHWQMPNAKIAIAIPSHEINDDLVDQCASYDVEVLAIPFNKIDPVASSRIYKNNQRRYTVALNSDNDKDAKRMEWLDNYPGGVSSAIKFAIDVAGKIEVPRTNSSKPPTDLSDVMAELENIKKQMSTMNVVYASEQQPYNNEVDDAEKHLIESGMSVEALKTLKSKVAKPGMRLDD